MRIFRFMKRSLIRADIAEAIYRQVGLSRNESSDMVGTIIEQISETLDAGDQVKITSFGSFLVRNKKERVGRNPKTGQEVPITPRRVLSFRPSHILRKKVNS